MASKTSRVPNYYNVQLNFNCGDYPQGTEIGYRYFYDNDFVYIPTYSNNISSSYYFYDDEFNNLFNKYSYSTIYRNWSTLNPFVKAKEISVSYRPVITEPLPSSSTYYKLLILGTFNGNEVSLMMRYDNTSLDFGIYVGAAGSFPTGYSGGIQPVNCPFYSASERAAKINYIIANARFYISGWSTCGENNLNVTTYDNNIALIVAVGNHYCWGPAFSQYSPSASGQYAILPSETEEYIPQPEPEPPSPSDDPYNPGGYSGGGGGPNPDGTGATGTGGLHDDTSDTIPTPSLPSNIATGSGLFTAYNPSASQLASFGNSLWSTEYTSFDELFKILFGGDAFNAIIGLHLLPVQPSTGASRNIKLGNWDSSVSAPVITNQYAKVEFGNLMLPEYWGNCIDYSPYTRIQLALPYIGIVDVDTDDVLGSNNNLTYNIDVFSGAVCATLQCSKGNLNSVIYQWSGSCAVELPVTGANYNSMLSTSVGAALGSGVFASKAMSAVIASGGGSPITAGVVSAGAIAGAASTIYGSSKGKVQRSGAFGSNAGALGIMTPYFIITRPVQSVPSSWQADKGYPANISAQLGTLLGYTEVSEINLECSGTEAEKKEIIDLLKKGVLF